MTSSSIAGLRVLVTGGAAGIGLALVKAFLAEGARVHTCDIDAKRLAEVLAAHRSLGGSVTDVANPASVAAMFEKVQRELGGLDALVNNAGISGPYGPVEDNDCAEWARTLEVNLGGQFNCAHFAVPLLRASGGGSIVNMSSIAGRLGFPLPSAYAASKWGIIGLTQTLAMELGPDNIRVNAILPGVVATERQLRNQKAIAERFGLDEEEMAKRYVQNISLRRKIDEQEVADLVLYVCSPRGRGITGQSLGICGGAETMRR